VSPRALRLGLVVLPLALACASKPAPEPPPAAEPTPSEPAPAADEPVPPAAAHRSWLQPPPPIDTGPVVDAERLHVSTLENGLTVMVFEDPRLPRFDAGLAVRRGAASEDPAEAGLATFLADLMERGAGERDALALAETVDGLGASFGVSAGWDSLHVNVSGLSRDLDTLFAVLADLALRPRLETEEAEKVRAEALARLERAKDEPNMLLSWNLARAVYGAHRFGRPMTGTPETVAGLDAERARAFHARLLVPGNAILYVSGDVTAVDAERRAREAFGDWPEAPVPDPGPAPPAPAPEARRIVIVDRPELGQAAIALAHEGLARTDPERIAAALMNSTLGGGGFSSRLMTVVRQREGLAYGIGSSFQLRRGGGPFTVGTATRVAEARRAIDLILGELEGIRERPPSADELAHAQTDAAGGFVLGLETSSAILGSLVELQVHGLPLDGLDTYRSRVAAVTVGDVAEQARKRVHPDRAAIVVVGPAEALAPALEDLGPIEVVQP
jgi:zinc protease